MNEISGQANTACCAHLTVYWTTQNNNRGLTRGWWQCGDCWTRFVPQIEYQFSSIPAPTSGAAGTLPSTTTYTMPPKY